MMYITVITLLGHIIAQLFYENQIGFQTKTLVIARGTCVFSHAFIQKGTPRLMQRVSKSMGVLSDVTVVLSVRQSIDFVPCGSRERHCICFPTVCLVCLVSQLKPVSELSYWLLGNQIGFQECFISL